MKRNLTYILAFFSLCLVYSCASFNLRTANDNYAQFAYAPAANDYEYYLSRKTDREAMINLADCYRQMNNHIKAEYWYSKLVQLPAPKSEWHLYLAQSQLRNRKYDAATENLEKYLSLNRGDRVAETMLESCRDTLQFYRDTSLFTVKLLPFCTGRDNYFSPAFYRGGIVYVSDRFSKGKSKSVSDFNGRPFLDLYSAKRTEGGNWMESEPIRGDINGKYNEGPLVFSRDYKTMYFTRNDYESNRLEKNERDINVLQIMRADFSDGIWILKGKMFVSNGEYSVAHPAISADGTEFYFVSMMPWGYGGTDIYRVKWLGENNWSAPENLGAGVNTPGNERFPFIYNDSILYFASDGWPGLGGLDVYQYALKGAVTKEPLNLGVPVNSSQDDFSFIVDSSGNHGYFSSSRYAGIDRIYSFVRNKPQLSIAIKLTEEGTGRPVPYGRIKVSDSMGDTVVVTGSDGTLFLQAQQNRNYTIQVSHADYYSADTLVSTQAMNFSGSLKADLILKRIVLNQPIVFKGIKFKKKDWQLKLESGTSLEALAELLRDNPSLYIEIASYTDSRDSDVINQKLTQRRAELVMQYLTNAGVSASRMQARGYGEQKLLNKCVNGILCIEEDHEVNNRIEISVLKTATSQSGL